VTLQDGGMREEVKFGEFTHRLEKRFCATKAKIRHEWEKEIRLRI
jgi:hypothetical protein